MTSSRGFNLLSSALTCNCPAVIWWEMVMACVIQQGSEEDLWSPFFRPAELGYSCCIYALPRACWRGQPPQHHYHYIYLNSHNCVAKPHAHPSIRKSAISSLMLFHFTVSSGTYRSSAKARQFTLALIMICAKQKLWRSSRPSRKAWASAEKESHENRSFQGLAFALLL